MKSSAALAAWVVVGKRERADRVPVSSADGVRDLTRQREVLCARAEVIAEAFGGTHDFHDIFDVSGQFPRGGGADQAGGPVDPDVGTYDGGEQPETNAHPDACPVASTLGADFPAEGRE